MMINADKASALGILPFILEGKSRRAKMMEMSISDRQAKYLVVAEQLAAGIRDGQFLVGSDLPTEMELCEHYSMSRYTAREALRILETEGLIRRRQGSGSRVVAQVPPPRYVMTLSSEEDVLRYASETTLHLGRAIPARVSAAAVRKFRLDPAVDWVRVSGIRKFSNGEIVAITEVMIRREYADALVGVKAHASAIFRTLSERYHFLISHIDQEIRARTLSSAVAPRLGVAPGEPALEIVRHFWDDRDRLVEVSVNLHPADRFRYSVTLERHVTRVPFSMPA